MNSVSSISMAEYRNAQKRAQNTRSGVRFRSGTTTRGKVRVAGGGH